MDSETLPSSSSAITSTINVCKGCRNELGEGNVISFAENYWHLTCFVCTKCKRVIEHDTRILVLQDGMPICEHCSYSCFSCGNPILDEAIMTGDMAFHEECFKCCKCGGVIEDLVFTKLPEGISCTKCTKAFRPPTLPRPTTTNTTTTITTTTPSSPKSPTLSNFENVKAEVLYEELKQTKEKLRATEAMLDKIKGASKQALDEFRKTKDELTREQQIREKSEKAIWLLKAELDKKLTIERELQDEIRALRLERQANEEGFGEIDRMKRAMEAAKVEIEILQRKKATLEQTNGELSQQQEELLNNIQNSLMKQEIETDQKRKETEYAHKEYEDQVQKLRQSIDAEINSLRVEKQGINTEVQQLYQERDRLSSSVQELSVEKQRLEATIPAMQDTYQKLSAELSKLEKLRQGENSLATVRKKGGAAFGSSLSSLFSPETKSSKGNLLQSPSDSNPTSPIQQESFASAFRESTIATRVPAATVASFKWVSNREKVKVPVKQHVFQPQSFLVPTKCAFCGDKIWGMKSKELQCKDCSIVCHQKCQSNLTGECKPDNQQQSQIMPQPPLFGTDLFEECEREERSVPSIVQRFVEELELRRGLDFEGIYRKSGSQSQIRLLIESLNASKQFGQDVDLSNDNVPDVNVLTGVLKQYFRMLPSPLTTYELYAELVQATMEQDAKQKLKIFVKALATLPVPNYETLKYLIAHLNKVSTMEDKNKMSPRNLAVVFGPNLIRSPASAQGASETTEIDADAELSDMGYKNAVIESLISKSVDIFKYADSLRAGQQPAIFDPSESDIVQESQRAVTERSHKKSSVSKPSSQQPIIGTQRGRSDTAAKKSAKEEYLHEDVITPSSYVVVSNDNAPIYQDETIIDQPVSEAEPNTSNRNIVSL